MVQVILIKKHFNWHAPLSKNNSFTKNSNLPIPIWQPNKANVFRNLCEWKSRQNKILYSWLVGSLNIYIGVVKELKTFFNTFLLIYVHKTMQSNKNMKHKTCWGNGKIKRTEWNETFFFSLWACVCGKQVFFLLFKQYIDFSRMSVFFYPFSNNFVLYFFSFFFAIWVLFCWDRHLFICLSFFNNIRICVLFGKWIMLVFFSIDPFMDFFGDFWWIYVFWLFILFSVLQNL